MFFQKRVFILAGAIFILVVFLTSFLVWFYISNPQSDETKEPQLVDRQGDFSEILKGEEEKYDFAEAEKWTTQLYQLIDQYSKADIRTKTQMTQHMINISNARKDQMLLLAEQNPHEFLKLQIPKETRDRAPEEIKENIEEWVSIEGNLNVLIWEDFDTGKGSFERRIQTKDKIISIYVDQNTERFYELISNTKISIQGYILEDKIVMPDAEENLNIIEDEIPPLQGLNNKNGAKEEGFLVGKAHAAPDTPFGDWSIAVILVNFLDDTSRYVSPAEIRAGLFDDPDSVNARFKEYSYGNFSISGDVYGYYTLPFNKPSNPTISQIFDAAVSAADADIFFPQYSSVLVVGPFNFPNTSGVGSVGQISYPTNDGLATFGRMIVEVWNSYSSIRGSLIGISTHEIGHNIGLIHSSAWNCGNNVVDNDPTSTCIHVEYGEPYDNMGFSNLGHFNALWKEYLGWIPTNQTQIISSDGSYSIEPLEINTGRLKLLKFPRYLPIDANTPWFFVEYRQPIGFDVFRPPSPPSSAVLHYNHSGQNASSSQRTWILDLTPPYQNAASLAMGLPVGSSYVDPQFGSSISVVSANSSQLTVNITLPQSLCVFQDPTVSSLSPSSQSGAGGDSLSYTFTVTNNDNSSCGPEVFDLTSDVSLLGSGWTETINPSSVTLNPGETSSQITITVTSPQNAQIGNNSFQTIATHSSDPTFSGTSGLGIYIVNPVVDNPPSVFAGVDQTIFLPTTTASINDSTVFDEDMATIITSWSQISGPAAANILSPSSINTDISGLSTIGTYVFELSATDNLGQTSLDSMSIAVSNPPPTSTPIPTSIPTLPPTPTPTLIMVPPSTPTPTPSGPTFLGTNIINCNSVSTIFSTLCALNITNISSIIGAFVNLFFLLGIIVALFYLIFGAVRWIYSGGDKVAIDRARAQIIAAVAGLVILFFVFLILNIILGFFNINIGLISIPQIP